MSLNERMNWRTFFKGDIVFSLVTCTWLYWFCEMRWFRKIIGGRWYKSMRMDTSFWSRIVRDPRVLVDVERWSATPLATANNAALGTLMRLLMALGVLTVLGGVRAFALAAPLTGLTGTVVWWVVVLVGIHRQRLV